MSEYYLGIDIGGTCLKACVIDGEGKMLSRKSMDTPVNSPKEGFYERDMKILDDAIITVIKDAIKISGVYPKEIKCVGATGHGKGLYLLDKKGDILRPAIASTDSRAESIVMRWKKDGTEEKARVLTLGPIVACQPAPLLLWLKENEREIYDRIGYVFEAKDYVRYVLTQTAFCEESDSSGTALMDIKKRQYSRELFDLYGISEIFDRMPPLKTCTDICGTVSKKASELTGLCEGTPVCGGMFDIDACALSCGKMNSEDICVVTGTWSINEYPSPNPETGSKSTKVSLFCDGKRYLIEESSPTSAGNLAWALNMFRTQKDYAKADKIAAKYRADSVNVVFLPFLYGTVDGFGAGTFAGLTTETTDEDMIRAVFEGVAFSHRMHIERLLKSDGGKKKLRITGGAAKSEIWMKIFADVTGMEVSAVDVKETGALGVAMASAVACGMNSSLEEAAEKMSGKAITYYPDREEHEKYGKKYNFFKKLCEVYRED